MQKIFEGLGHLWLTVMKDPRQEIPVMIPYVLREGVTREAWQVKTEKLETITMVWPQEGSFRAAVTLQGPPDGKLKPKSCAPLLDGVVNDLTVDDIEPWASGVEGNISAFRNEGAKPIWFYNPLLARDKGALTPGVRQSFVISALATGLRRGLLDDMNITQGSMYEEYAAKWLSENPEASRLDVPQLSIDLRGARILMPSDAHGNYQVRCPISSLDECQFADEAVYLLGVEFGLETENPLRFVIYAPKRICNNIEPKVGDEIDAIIWLQGRIID